MVQKRSVKNGFIEETKKLMHNVQKGVDANETMANLVALYYHLNKTMPLWKQSPSPSFHRFETTVKIKTNQFMDEVDPEFLPMMNFCSSLIE